MSINAKQLSELIIQPTLQYLGFTAPEDTILLLGTCAKETDMGSFIKQLPNGPALGIYCTEPFTHHDVIDRYLMINKKQLYTKVISLVGGRNVYTARDTELVTNLAYATAVARCVYLMAPEPIPHADDIAGMARYWKLYYNKGGKGTEQQFIENYNRYVKL